MTSPSHLDLLCCYCCESMLRAEQLTKIRRPRAIPSYS